MIWVKIVVIAKQPSLIAMTEPAVELTNASKRYGDVQALQDVSLSIEAGDVVAMLGPNGAGKTTSISLMLGLRNPTSGRVRLFGLDPKDRRARSRVGVMLQESGVPGVLRVEEIVDLFRSYYPASLPRDEAIKMAGLEAKARSQVKDLSGGQHQRLYLALALCGNPDTLFLDEPTVGMDVEGRRLFLQEIADLAAKGRTVILTTHYLEEADQLARRIIVINRGRVIADASPAAIKSRVAGKRVTFSTTAPPDDGLFAGLPLSSKQVEDHRVRLLTNEPENVLRELFRRGVEIHDLEISGADLEEAFVAMTRRDMGPA
jgi:ABC-2 type transport system ATP-binding protein